MTTSKAGLLPSLSTKVSPAVCVVYISVSWIWGSSSLSDTVICKRSKHGKVLKLEGMNKGFGLDFIFFRTCIIFPLAFNVFCNVYSVWTPAGPFQAAVKYSLQSSMCRSLFQTGLLSHYTLHFSLGWQQCRVHFISHTDVCKCD